MRDKALQANIDNSDPLNYPNKRIKDNDGSGNGTPVNEQTKGDIHEFFDKMLRLYGITHNNLPDNETNGYQTIEALIAIASKNDYILDLTSNGTIFSVPVKLSKMLTGESIVCKASNDKGSETQIQGSVGSAYSITYVGDFKTGEYVRLIKTASGVTLIRLVDAVNLDVFSAALGFLKAATQAQEDAGTSDEVATTPISNLTAFIKRINGVDSGSYLAKPTGDADERDGLLSHEDKFKIDNFDSGLRNQGNFSGLDVGTGSDGDLYTTGGDITQAVLQSHPSNRSIIRCTMANAMDNTNYYVKTFIRSNGTIETDMTIHTPVFKPVSITQFDLGFNENVGAVQSLIIYVEVIQL